MAAKLLAAAVLAALALAAPATADQEVIRHGRSIGKVRLGMSVTQVRGLLGRERTVNIRERRGTRGYVYLELDWDYGWWTVGFMRQGREPFEAVRIGVGQRAQRTAEGFGMGTLKSELQRRLDAHCRTVMNATRGTLLQQECVQGDPGRPQTVFVLATHVLRGDTSPRVRYVEVRAPLFYRGWRVRFERG